MSVDTIDLPARGSCTIIARVQADYLQRITVEDLELGQTYGPWTGHSHPKHKEIGRAAVNTTYNGLKPYRLKVRLEHSPDGGKSWAESTSKYFVFPPGGGPEPWIYSILGSEDKPGDRDWNDAYVVFSFPFHLVSSDGVEEIEFDPAADANAIRHAATNDESDAG